MSHTTTIKLQMKNPIAATLAICDAMGLEASEVETYNEPQVLHGYTTSQNRTAHVIVRKDTLTKRGLGTFGDFGVLLGEEGACHFDELDTEVSKKMGSLRQHYAKHVVLERARKAGQHVDVDLQVDGSIKLTVRG